MISSVSFLTPVLFYFPVIYFDLLCVCVCLAGGWLGGVILFLHPHRLLHWQPVWMALVEECPKC